MTNESSLELTYVSIFSCFIIDLPNDGSGLDCSQTNQSNCIKCATKMIRFFSGEVITDIGGWGHSISFWIWLLILTVGFCGILMNLFIIIILYTKDKRNGQSIFDYLVTFLAVFDTFCSIASILAATSIISIFEGWISRGSKWTLYFYYYSNIGLMFTRSLSTHMTVYINIFCYLGLAHTLKAKKWFTVDRVKIIPVIVIVTAIVLSIPRFITAYVDKNSMDIPSIEGLDYILYMRTMWTLFWYKTLKAPNEQLDVPLPLLILLVFNFLSWRKMVKIRKSRENLTSNQTNNLHPVRMFLPVVTILLLSNIGPIAENLVGFAYGVMYRELTLATNLSHGINCAINFIIYYWRGKAFRKDAKKLFFRVRMSLEKRFCRNHGKVLVCNSVEMSAEMQHDVSLTGKTGRTTS